jgi:hypothetical protein
MADNSNIGEMAVQYDFAHGSMASASSLTTMVYFFSLSSNIFKNPRAFSLTYSSGLAR